MRTEPPPPPTATLEIVSRYLHAQEGVTRTDLVFIYHRTCSSMCPRIVKSFADGDFGNYLVYLSVLTLQIKKLAGLSKLPQPGTGRDGTRSRALELLGGPATTPLCHPHQQKLLSCLKAHYLLVWLTIPFAI